MLRIISRPSSITRIAKQQHRFSTATTTTTTTATPPRTISRSAWNAYIKKHPLKPEKAKQKSKKEEEKPWPKKMVLGGYAAASIFIPYSIAWYLSMNRELREIVLPTMAEDTLRTWFGVEEDTPYQDLRDGRIPRKRLVDEELYTVRKQLEHIKDLATEDVPLRMHIIHNNDGDSSTTNSTIEDVKKIPGTTPTEKINEYVPGELNNNRRVALDFLDLQNNENDDSSIFHDDINNLRMEEALPNSKNNSNIYSTWFYYAPTEERPKVQRVTDQDIQIAKFEYKINQLEQQMQDIYSTRDIDDLQQELKQVKSNLRGLKWKRRLGLEK